MPISYTIIIALLGGFIPVFLWLWFWEHEDKYPEPKMLVLRAFIAGMLAVVAVVPLEQYVAKLKFDTTSTVLMWSFIEESVKLLAAYIFVLRSKENDEPIDSMMYLITVALGFAALENTLFILNPLLAGNNFEALITGNLRFVGATLLHTVASGLIGLCLALSFFKPQSIKRLYVIVGLGAAVILHAFFNLSIILNEGSNVLFSFYIVWIATVLILLFFEKVKYIKE